ncbi:MAG: DinB family protein [Jatrophihabitans sp.]
MSAYDPKPDLQRYLRLARDAMVWKSAGLSEYDKRRPLTPTGTNLLGMIKHVASVEAGYFGATFGRPFGEPMPWFDDDAETDADLWATPDETSDDIIAFYRRASAHADATIEALPLDAVGTVPWWPADRAEVTLHRTLIHMIAETNRHAGQADIVRELLDGSIGVRFENTNLPDVDPQWWRDYHARVEQAAVEAANR